MATDRKLGHNTIMFEFEI